MNKQLTKSMISVVTLFIIAVILSACGGKPVSSPSPSPTSPSPTTTSAPPQVDLAAMRAEGEQLYQKTAGGVGCAACHGADAKGTNSGPDIQGKTADDIGRALGGDAMSFIRLTEEDIQAVAAYLKYLESLP